MHVSLIRSSPGRLRTGMLAWYKAHSQMVTKESQKTHALSMSHRVLDVV